MSWIARRGATVLAAGVIVSASAGAAGGHHAVDDAAIMEPGRCELEGWLARSNGTRLLHSGAGCRLGPVELALAAESARGEGGRLTSYGVQAKWAREWRPGLSAGWSLSSGWQTQARPRYQGISLAGLLTWAARDDLALHLNIGRDLAYRAADQNRAGVAIEWSPRPGWSFVGERYLEDRTHLARAGLRWAVNDAWTVDLSRAHRLRGPGESEWTLGASWQFDRP